MRQPGVLAAIAASILVGLAVYLADTISPADVTHSRGCAGRVLAL